MFASDIACIYKRLDVNGDGVLSGRELRKGLQFLGLNPTKDDIKRIKAEHNLKSSEFYIFSFKTFHFGKTIIVPLSDIPMFNIIYLTLYKVLVQ